MTVELSAFAAVSAVLLVLAWIGYTLASTPPPAPLEDFKLREGEEVKEKEGKLTQ